MPDSTVSASLWLPAAIAGALFAATAAAFSPALDAEYVNFDDPGNVLKNPLVQELSPAAVKAMFQQSHMGHYHPLTWLSYALEGTGGSFDPVLSHGINLVFHALTAVMVLFLVREVWRSDAKFDRSNTAAQWVAAGIAAGLFALHPLRVESVVWVSERRDVLSGFFLVAAAFAWCRGRRVEWRPGGDLSPLVALALLLAAAGMAFGGVDLSGSNVAVRGPALLLTAGLCFFAGVVVCARNYAERPLWYGCAVALALVSLLSKAWGIVLPGVLLILECWLWRARSRREWWLLLVALAPFAVLSAAFMILAGFAQRESGVTMLSLSDHTLWERLLQALYGLSFYPWKLLLPYPLIPVYELPDVISLRETRFWLGAVATLAVTAVLFFGRRRFRGLWYAWLLYVVIVSPVLGFVQSGPQLVADRYSYLCCLPLVGLVAAGWLSLSGRWRRLALPAVVVVLASLSAMTRSQAKIWRNSRSLWQHAYMTAPENAIACFGYASTLEQAANRAEDHRERRQLLERAQAVYEQGYRNRGKPRFLAALARAHLTLFEADQKPENRKAAIDSLQELLEVMAGSGDEEIAAYKMQLGLLLLQAGRPKPAKAHLHWCLNRGYFVKECSMALGRWYRSAGDESNARRAFEQVLKIDPHHAGARRNLAELAAQQD